MKEFRIPVWALSIAAVMISGPIQADRLVMSNGDVITGKLTQVTDKEVMIKPNHEINKHMVVNQEQIFYPE